MNIDTYVPYPCLGSWDSLDPLNETFTTDKSIIEVMSLNETPWNNLHHNSSFLPSLSEMPSCLEVYISHNPTHPLQTSILVHEVLSEGNMGNIVVPCLSIFPLNLELLRTLILGFPILLMRSGFILKFSKNFKLSSHGHMRRCLVLMWQLWCMKHLPILVQSLFANGFVP